MARGSTSSRTARSGRERRELPCRGDGPDTARARRRILVAGMVVRSRMPRREYVDEKSGRPTRRARLDTRCRRVPSVMPSSSAPWRPAWRFAEPLHSQLESGKHGRGISASRLSGATRLALESFWISLLLGGDNSHRSGEGLRSNDLGFDSTSWSGYRERNFGPAVRVGHLDPPAAVFGAMLDGERRSSGHGF